MLKILTPWHRPLPGSQPGILLNPSLLKENRNRRFCINVAIVFISFFQAYQMEIKDNGENDFLCVFSFFLLIPPLRHYDRVLILESATTLYRDIRQIIPLVYRTWLCKRWFFFRPPTVSDLFCDPSLETVRWELIFGCITRYQTKYSAGIIVKTMYITCAGWNINMGSIAKSHTIWIELTTPEDSLLHFIIF